MNEFEAPGVVIDRLMRSEPRWEPHPKDSSLSKSGEPFEVFKQRHAAWQDAVRREMEKAGRAK